MAGSNSTHNGHNSNLQHIRHARVGYFRVGWSSRMVHTAREDEPHQRHLASQAGMASSAVR